MVTRHAGEQIVDVLHANGEPGQSHSSVAITDSMSEENAFRLWASAMSKGDYVKAWKFNRRRGRHWPSAHCLWQGEELQGADLTIHSLHGLGDAVQMLRYMSGIRSTVRSLRLIVPEPLRPLLPCFKGLEDLKHAETWGPGSPPIEKSVDLEIMELPYVLHTRIEDLPLAARYLVAPPQRSHTNGENGYRRTKLKIGVVWSGGDWDSDRRIPLTLLEPLLLDGRYEWWNLQGGLVRDHAMALPMIQPPTGGLVQLTRVIAEMDLVLTVDTLAAHLAGALGVPVWLMLKQAADWRWMAEGDRSPWYPSMRLFRQPSADNWEAVVDQIRRALREQAVPSAQGRGGLHQAAGMGASLLHSSCTSR